MERSLAETLMGAAVLLVAVFFGMFAYNSSNMKPANTYPLKAKFDSVDGVGIGNDVRIGGVKIGVVSDVELDPETYMAVMTIEVGNGIKLSKDTSASIVSESLLGSKYVSLSPGGDETNLKAGDYIKHTQSSVNIESLIGRFMFSDKGENKEGTQN